MAISIVNDNISVNEALFCHIMHNHEKWLIGLINTSTKYFRIESVIERTNNIEKIIRHHICESNNIITACFTSYNWLNNTNTCFNHIIHIHG